MWDRKLAALCCSPAHFQCPPPLKLIIRLKRDVKVHNICNTFPNVKTASCVPPVVWLFWTLSIPHSHVEHREVEGAAQTVFLIPLSQQLIAAYRLILHSRGSLGASAKKLITILCTC